MSVLRRLKADPRTSTIPVVILTSSKEERDFDQGLRVGGQTAISRSRWTSSSSGRHGEERGIVLAPDQSASGGTERGTVRSAL